MHARTEPNADAEPRPNELRSIIDALDALWNIERELIARTGLGLQSGERSARPDGARPVGQPSAVARLRPREIEVLLLYAIGLSTAEIASALVLSPHTLRTHVKNALGRLGVHSRSDAVDLIRRAGQRPEVALAARRVREEVVRWAGEGPLADALDSFGPAAPRRRIPQRITRPER